MRKWLNINNGMLLLFSIFFMIVPIIVSIVTSARPVHTEFQLHHFDTSSVFFRVPWLRFMLQQLILLSLFFVNYGILVPRLLIVKRNWLQYITVVGALSCTTFFIVYFTHSAIDVAIGFNPMPIRMRFLHVILHLLMAIVVSLLWKFLLENHRLQQIQQRILQEKTQAELQFLQSQINPHFLLNTLNTLYSLSINNASETPGLILKLSDILKFTLYDAGRTYVLLSKELGYIKDYVEIQSLRLNQKTRVSMNISGEFEEQMIHPMLLIPFIENAFKHGVSTSKEVLIEIRISVEKNALNLLVRNAILERKNPLRSEASGVGLENVRKRLNLLYPMKHVLEISNDNAYFTVNLKLLLTDDEVSGT